MDDGRGNAVLSLGYQETDPVYQGDRDFGVQSIDSYTGAAGGSGTTVPGVFSTGAGTRQLNSTGTALVPIYSRFNFNPYNIYQTPFRRFNIFGSTKYEVSDHLEFYSQAMFSKNTVSTIIAPSGTFGNTLTIPISNPYLSGGVRDTFCLNAVDADPNTAGRQAPTQAQCNSYYGATSTTDPNYRTFNTSASRRFVEAGPRISEYTTQLFNIRAGVRGALVGNFNYDVFGLWRARTFSASRATACCRASVRRRLRPAPRTASILLITAFRSTCSARLAASPRTSWASCSA